jgi:hypothetical protein
VQPYCPPAGSACFQWLTFLKNNFVFGNRGLEPAPKKISPQEKSFEKPYNLSKGDVFMQSGLKSVLGGLLLIFCFLLSSWPAAAQNAPQDHSQIYKRAVGALDGAEKKLAGNYTAEAKNLLKESRSLFGILQKEMPEKMKTTELTQAQDDQYSSNQKLAEDSTAQGEKLDKSAGEKQKKADSMETSGNQDMAIKLQQEVVQEQNLAQKAHLKAEIYHLKNLQLIFGSLK